MPIKKYGRVWLVLDYGNAIVGSKPNRKEAELADIELNGHGQNPSQKTQDINPVQLTLFKELTNDPTLANQAS